MRLKRVQKFQDVEYKKSYSLILPNENMYLLHLFIKCVAAN